MLPSAMCAEGDAVASGTCLKVPNSADRRCCCIKATLKSAMCADGGAVASKTCKRFQKILSAKSGSKEYRSINSWVSKSTGFINL